jgi:ABC-2 type transport system ATP-binding protein
MSIELLDISKRYGKFLALDQVSIQFEREKIYGLLGRNGAGKTTMMNLIANCIFSDAGKILIDGDDIVTNPTNIGSIYMMTDKKLYPDPMRVGEVFRWTDAFYGGFDHEFAEVLCKRFDLNKKSKIASLSTGYRSIFKIIVALCVKAQYILLDEPVLGLDAGHREKFYKSLLETYAETPRTFIISTHLIEEVASIIEDVVIIDQGKILRNCSVEALLQSGYNITGSIADVDAYCSNRETIGSDTIGGIKTAAILGKAENVPVGLTVSPLDLQKLFVRMTESSEVD